MKAEMQTNASSTRERPDSKRFLIQRDMQLSQSAAVVAALECAVEVSVGNHDIELLRLLALLQDDLSQTKDYQHALKSAFACSPRREQPWRCRFLIDTPQLRVGILTLFRFAPIPLHDHPGACGVQWLLSGRLKAGHYDLDKDVDPEQRLVWLNCRSVREYNPGESACYHSSSMNLHELTSISARSVVLSLMIHPYDEKQRSWYFPVKGLSTINRGLYTRIRKPAGTGIGRFVERSATGKRAKE